MADRVGLKKKVVTGWHLFKGKVRTALTRSRQFMPKPKRLAESEFDIMNAVWEAQIPVCVRDVHQQLYPNGVILQLTVVADGTVETAEVIQSLDSECDEAALDAVKNIKWKPVLAGDTPVAVTVSVPIVFKKG